MRYAIPFLLLVASCGSINVRTADARAVTEAAFDCIDSVEDSDDLRAALLACGVDTLRTITTLCAAGVIPRGEFCDAVGGVL